MPNYVYMFAEGLGDDEEVELRATGIGTIKIFERNASRAFSIRVDVQDGEFRTAARTICDAIRAAPPSLAEIIRTKEPQLAVVIEGSNHDGFPPLGFDVETVSCLADLKASVSVDIYCFDEVGPRDGPTDSSFSDVT